jgi:hypothetical protein
MRKLPYPEDGERVETGPLQFEGDWPGVFIRGDNALHFAMVLEMVLHRDDLHPIMEDAPLKGLMATLRSCDHSTTSVDAPAARSL